MKIYNYDQTTGEFLGESDARESPLEAGVFLIPAGATADPPPAAGPHQVPVFANGQWSLAADWRHDALWETATAAPARIMAIGVVPEDVGLTAVAPPPGPVKWIAGAWQPDLEAARAAAIANVDVRFEAAAAGLIGAFPPSERLSWPVQEKEALAWRADAAAPTPYIDAVALARGLDRITQINRVLGNVDAFHAASARLIGTRQKYVDQVRAAVTQSDIDAVNPVFT